jgi:hypothetical protein
MSRCVSPDGQYNLGVGGASSTYAVSPGVRWLRLGLAAVAVIGGFGLALFVAYLPATLTEAAPPLLGLVLAAIVVASLTRSASALREVAWVGLERDGLRARDLLGRQRYVAWSQVADVREVHGEVTLVSREGHSLLRLSHNLCGFEDMANQIRSRALSV